MSLLAAFQTGGKGGIVAPTPAGLTAAKQGASLSRARAWALACAPPLRQRRVLRLQVAARASQPPRGGGNARIGRQPAEPGQRKEAAGRGGGRGAGQREVREDAGSSAPRRGRSGPAAPSPGPNSRGGEGRRPRSEGSGGRTSGGGGGGGRGTGGRGRGGGGRGLPNSDFPLLKAEGTWRLSNVKVPLEDDGGKDDFTVTAAVLRAAAAKMRIKQGALHPSDITVVKKSFDARQKARKSEADAYFVYNLDVDAGSLAAHLAAHPGDWRNVSRVSSRSTDVRAAAPPPPEAPPPRVRDQQRAVVVGSGPAGLFAALALAEGGVNVVLLERGEAVEARGRDIGALMARRVLNPESNLCYGEGGAGTWSDGKLTTRIGKNTTGVRRVMESLVEFGAPERILMMSKPHLGTDRLVMILRAFRARLVELGVEVRFGARVEDVIVEGGRAVGVELEGGESIRADHTVLAVGHSARILFERLQANGVAMTQKEFALGFRVEHPQDLIDTINYGRLASGVERGKGKVPVADYRVAADGQKCWSFCMCPGGQVVCTSTTEDELCVNGMSFSKRASPWANSALVTPVGPGDFAPWAAEHGALAGMEMQREAERRAAEMGGGAFVAPVQRVTDFLEGRPSTGELPKSSYRLGVRAGMLDELYPPAQIAAMRAALVQFERSLPGFLSADGLLHGVETRTSSPVRIDRGDNYESVSTPGLYPLGEGAGYAGGIMSAALDGLLAGEAMVARMTGAEPSRGAAGTRADRGMY